MLKDCNPKIASNKYEIVARTLQILKEQNVYYLVLEFPWLLFLCILLERDHILTPFITNCKIQGSLNSKSISPMKYGNDIFHLRQFGGAGCGFFSWDATKEGFFYWSAWSYKYKLTRNGSRVNLVALNNIIKKELGLKNINVIC